MKTNNIDATFIALNEYVKDPEFIIDDTSEFVKFGEDNELPKQLIEYYRNVSIHRAIIDKKKKMFIGKGVTIDYSDDKRANKTIEFLNNINEFENIDELFDKISLDVALFNGVYLQIIWEKGGKKIKNVYHMPYEQMRSGKKDKFGQVRKFYYNISEDKNERWRTYTSVKDKNIIEFDAFSTISNKNKPQIMYIHEYEPGTNYYSLPDYIGALKDLNTMQAIADFHNANIHNNMQPGLTIFFNGPTPDKETKNAIVKNIKKKYSNTENAGRPMIFWLEENQEIKMEQPESSDVSNMYKLLSEDIKENIIVAHQITRAISGLANPGSLGNTKEILEGMELVRSNYIKPLQEFILSKFNKIMEINKLDRVELQIPSPNLMKYSISDLQKVLTVNEIREFLGKEPIEEENKVDDIEKDIIDDTTTEEK